MKHGINGSTKLQKAYKHRKQKKFSGIRTLSLFTPVTSQMTHISFRTQFVQQGTIDAKGLGSVSSFVERFAKSFLVQGGSKVYSYDFFGSSSVKVIFSLLENRQYNRRDKMLQ